MTVKETMKILSVSRSGREKPASSSAPDAEGQPGAWIRRLLDQGAKVSES